MGDFLHKYNTDDVHIRAVIVGLVNLLNNRIVYKNILSDTESDDITVPFFYSMTGDERFLQDYFMEWNDCLHPKVVEGNYDIIPRGIVNLESSSINTSAMTHRFVRGTYVKEVSGELQTFSAYLNSIPLTMSFKVSVETDTTLDAFKIYQSIIEVFYKTQVYSIMFKGFRVPCQVGFPEDFGFENEIEFSYQSDKKIKIDFDINLETYLPVTDDTSVRKNSNRMDNVINRDLQFNLELTNETKNKSFTFELPKSNEVYFSGSYMPISYTTTGSMSRINLYYRIAGTDDWISIIKNIENNGNYLWLLPFFDEEIVPYTNDKIKYHINSNCGTGGKLRGIINNAGELESIIVLDSGNGYTNEDTVDFSVILSNTTPTVLVAPEVSLNIAEGKIVGATIHQAGSGFPINPTVFIELKIENFATNVDYQISDIIDTFTADADPDHINGGDDLKTLRNINPDITTLIANGVEISGILEGPGIYINTEIVSYDILNNTILLDRLVSNFNEGGIYSLSKRIQKFEIK